jgi:hypothetical protein
VRALNSVDGSSDLGDGNKCCLIFPDLEILTTFIGNPLSPYYAF